MIFMIAFVLVGVLMFRGHGLDGLYLWIALLGLMCMTVVIMTGAWLSGVFLLLCAVGNLMGLQPRRVRSQVR